MEHRDREKSKLLNDADIREFDDAEARLTAYALGEIDDADVVREIDAAIEHDADARQLVEGVRATAAMLSSELRAEEGSASESAQPVLSSVDRQSMVNAALAGAERTTAQGAHAGPYPFPPLTQSKWFRMSAALAAVAAIGTFVTVISSPTFRPTYTPSIGEDQFAMLDDSASNAPSARGRGGAASGAKGRRAEGLAQMAPSDPNADSETIEFWFQHSDESKPGSDLNTTLQHGNEGSVQDRIAVLRSEGLQPDESADLFTGMVNAPQEETGPAGGAAASREDYKLRYRNFFSKGDERDSADQYARKRGRADGEDGGGEFAGEGFFGLMESAPPVREPESETAPRPAAPASSAEAVPELEAQLGDIPKLDDSELAESEELARARVERRDRISEKFAEIRQAQQEGDYDTAIELTEKLARNAPNNSTLRALHDVLEAQKVYSELPVDERSRADHVDHRFSLDSLTTLESTFPLADSPQDLEQLVRTRERQIVNEEYARIYDNEFKAATEEPLSTFSIDVDTASYANVRRFLKNMGTLPPADAVRIEEMLNSFDYSYEPPTKESEHPFAVHTEIADCPWNAEHRLVKIGLKGYEVPADDRPASNLVFLIDSSGSMDDQNKLPLVQRSLTEMIDNLTVDDRIAIVTYAGSSRLVLDSTPVFEREKIVAAVNSLNAGGSTNGEGGITQAYDVATDHFIEGGTNRVILCTDGDFNVGVSDNNGLLRLIEEKRETGVFLSVLGFGMGNYKDNKLETLANKGNGNYAYIDNYDEAKKVLVDRMAGTLVTIAKDVKIQVDFNPTAVSSYRLIGYENRVMAARDFNDDTKDAGEIGAGHTVTALYEVVPAESGGELVPPDDIDESVYMETKPSERAESSGELMTIRLRYKQPDEDESTLWTVPVMDPGESLAESSEDFRFAAAVASFGMALRQSPYAGDMDYQRLLDLAVGARGEEDDQPGMTDRNELISLIKEAHRIAPSMFEPRLAVESDEKEDAGTDAR